MNATLLFDDTEYFPLFSGICQQQPTPKTRPVDLGYTQTSLLDAPCRHLPDWCYTQEEDIPGTYTSGPVTTCRNCGEKARGYTIA